MASYLDNIPTFNEYVEQRPQDEMLKVGLYKQQRYEEGVQKIQNSIDNIAGLDVIQPAQREYLQSQLNALGGQLSNFAASDFSNFQLVNSVNGMTNQLVKDPVILNAVSSSSQYRKQIESMEKIDADGKGSESNKFIFNEQVANWLNGDVNAQFSAVYKPYVDYQDQALDVVKALVQADNPQITDVAFQRDKNGRIVGILDAITRTRVEGISADKIQAALMTGLQPDAFQQMSNDGRFKYSNVDDQVFADDLNNSYTATFDALIKEKNTLQGLMASASQADEKLKIQRQIESIDAQAEMLRREYDDVSASFQQGEVESAKAKFYTTNWIKDFSNTHSNLTVSQTYETNPFKTVQLRNADLAFKIAKDERDYKLKVSQFNQEMEIEKKKLELLQNPYGPVDLGLENLKDKSPVEIIAAYQADKTNKKQNLDTLKRTIMSRYGLDEDAFNTNIANLLQKNGTIAFDQKKDLYEYLRLEKDYNRSRDLIAHLEEESRIINEFDATALEGGSDIFQLDDYTYTNGEAAELISKFEEQWTVLKGTGSVLNPLNRFKTPQQESFVDTNMVIPGSSPEALDLEDILPIAESQLSDREFNLFKLWATGRVDKDFNEFGLMADPFDMEYGDGSNNSGEGYLDAYTYINDFYDKYSSKLEEVNEKRNDYIAEQLNKTNLLYQPTSTAIPLRNTSEINSFKGVIAQLVNDEAARDGTSKSDFLEISGDLESADIIKLGPDASGNNQYNLNINDGDGNTQTFKLSQVQYDRIFRGRFDQAPNIEAFNELYLPSMLDTQMPLETRQVQDSDGNFTEVLAKDPNSYYTTATDYQYQTTLFNPGLVGEQDFPNVRLFSVQGNLVSDMNPKDDGAMFKLQLIITDPRSGEPVPPILFPGLIAKDKVVPTLQSLTDEIIFQLLYKRNPTQEEINQLLNASQQY